MICQRPAHKACGILWEYVGGMAEPGGGGARPRVTERIEREDASEGDLLRGRYGYPDITIHLTLFSASIAEGVPELLEHNDLKWITPSEIDRFE